MSEFAQITIEEAQSLFNKSRATIYNWMNSGRLKFDGEGDSRIILLTPDEIEKLKELEAKRKIDILYCSYGVDLPENKKKLIDTEDDLILEAAVATESILFTADKGLKDKAISIKQPVIYIPPKFQKGIKELADEI